jgi:putative aldouronate transport system permease protein
VVHGKSASERIFNAANVLLMTMLALATLYPFYYAAINSFNSGNAILRGFSAIWPDEPSAASWRTVLSDATVARAFGVSALRTALVTAGSLFITSMFAYAYSRTYLAGKKFYTALGFTCMYFSGGVIPFFLLISWMGMYDTFGVYVIPSLFGGFYNVIIYNANFKALPDSLFESAKLDGASERAIYFRIVLPLSKPVIAALGVFTAVGVWNDFTASLYYTQNPDLQTLQYFILKLIRSYNATEQLASSAMANDAVIANLLNNARGMGEANSKTIELAAMMLSSLPMILVYPFAQKFFVHGMLLGSVKE